MGLDIYALRHPTFVKAYDDARTDEDYDTLTLVHNDPAFTGHGDGMPEGFYSGESIYHGRWSYGGYNELRKLICRAALGMEPEVLWNAPACFRPTAEAEGFVALIHFSDCEGAIGPVTSRKIADALTGLSLDALPSAADREYATDGVAKLLACFLDAAATDGFALWR